MEKDLKVALLVGVTVVSVVAVVFYEPDNISQQDRLRSTVSGTMASAARQRGQAVGSSNASGRSYPNAYHSNVSRTQRPAVTVRTLPRVAYPAQSTNSASRRQWYGRSAPPASRFPAIRQPVRRGAVLRAPQFRAPPATAPAEVYRRPPTALRRPPATSVPAEFQSNSGTDRVQEPLFGRRPSAPTLSIPAVRSSPGGGPIGIWRPWPRGGRAAGRSG